MAKKLLFVVLLLALAITSVDLVVNVSATGELLGSMRDATSDMIESPKGQTADHETSSESWADWAKDKFSGFGGGSGSSSQDDAQAPSPVVA